MTTETTAPAELTEAQRKALTALEARPGARAAEIALAAGIGGSTAGKALTRLESYNLAYREHGERVGARRTADRWYLRAAEAAPEPAEAEATAADQDTPPEAADSPEPTATAPQRLARGGLREMVLDHLRAHPDKDHTAPAIAKRLERSAGAVANALGKLTELGEARQTGTKPRTYRPASA
jgi:predicted transcriptional regulator